MTRQIVFAVFISMCVSMAARASVIYSVSDLDSGGQMLAIENAATGETYEGPKEQYLNIRGIRDFNNDGIDDVLISTWNGGSCCDPEFSVITLVNGHVISASLDADTDNVSIEQKNETVYVVVTNPDSAKMYSFNGESMVLYRTIENLVTIKEIHGPGGKYIDEMPPIKLLVDVDENGKQDEIVCDVWPRWGSLLCALPLPDGKTQGSHTGCARFGMLKTMNNGYHEFVCDFDSVITFDGKRWVGKSGAGSEPF